MSKTQLQMYVTMTMIHIDGRMVMSISIVTYHTYTPTAFECATQDLLTTFGEVNQISSKE